jgi:tRNA dimethylallyltransferase
VAPPEPPLVAIVGETASGKSALALALAREHGGEIVSCDSLQVYRGLDIGSAKPSPEELRAVPHHLVDVADPDEEFSAARYAALARAAVASLRERGVLPVVVGGTGLYLRALLQGLFAGPSRDDALRARLERMAARFGVERLHRLLSRVDPAAAERIHARDGVRIVRALEVFRATGRRISDEQRQGSEPLAGFRVLRLGLAPPRETLLRAVERRTREMMQRGLVDEVRGLLARGYPPTLRPLRAIGYLQALAVVQGRLTPAQAEAEIVAETMRFAKRQRTWFRHQEPGTEWFAQAEDAVARAREWLRG